MLLLPLFFSADHFLPFRAADIFLDANIALSFSAAAFDFATPIFATLICLR